MACNWPIPLLAGSFPPHITLGNLADHYGPIFTIKLGVHPTLVVSNLEMAKECLTTNDKAFASRPKSLAREILGYDCSMFGFAPYGEYWRQMRKIATVELLSNHRLEKLKHVREAEVKAAVEGLHKRWKESRSSSNEFVAEMKRWFSDVTLNVILKINTSDALPFLRWLDLGGVERAMKKTAKELDDLMQGLLEEHKQKKASGTANAEEEDFIDVLLSTLNDAEDLSRRDADTINKATCLTLILAASDTTTITLTWTLSLLLNNPDVLKKAQCELDIHVGKERQVKESDMKNLVYLQAIIKESFSLYPAAPLSVPHESIEDCTVGGYHIPAGTRLIVNISKIHRDSRVWLNPSEFQPERFLTTHKNIDVKGQNFELIPFSSGRRMCPGVSFALQVLNLTLATLLHAFQIVTPSGKPVDMSESAGLTNLKATPLEAVLTPRLSAHLYY
ncbi:hypothetical protein GH714_014301 [Hevea brasiliensis]|uniref:Cytochrome P450 n=1 Tax=Hevea brasiliensis TaxID=3981 RepID=A0A6A6NH20_HEVBR|nr:hypothetical protein GH714_014301 [Hevea brasiliensis]